MKRVTFRVPEDHEIAVSATVAELVVEAKYEDAVRSISVRAVRNFDDSLGYEVTDRLRKLDHGCFDTLDAAQAKAADAVRDMLRADVLGRKIKAFA